MRKESLGINLWAPRDFVIRIITSGQSNLTKAPSPTHRTVQWYSPDCSSVRPHQQIQIQQIQSQFVTRRLIQAKKRNRRRERRLLLGMISVRGEKEFAFKIAFKTIHTSCSPTVKRQVIPRAVHCYRPDSKSQTAYRLVQPFLHSSPQCPVLYNGPPLPPSKVPHPMWDLDQTPSNSLHGSLDPPQSLIQTESRLVQSFLQGRSHYCDRQTTLLGL